MKETWYLEKDIVFGSFYSTGSSEKLPVLYHIRFYIKTKSADDSTWNSFFGGGLGNGKNI